MKRLINIIYVILILLISSCTKSGTGNQTESHLAEVELVLFPSGAPISRSDEPIPDAGHTDERYIEELDLLIFDASGYSYHREAYKVDELNKFRVTLVETDQTLTAYLFANCRSIIREWELENDKTGLEWSTVQSQIKDISPTRLVKPDVSVPLPMWGKTSGEVSTSSIKNWGVIQMLRSVASVDLYVEQNSNTDLFTLTDLYLYYGPDQGYLAPKPNSSLPDQYECVSPPEMTTSLTNQLHAKRVENFSFERDNTQFNYEGIVYQIYIYDNDVTASEVSANKRFSRAIMGGYYNQTGSSDTWVKSYYPLDFVFSNGEFRTIVRNWKYEFCINGVYGPGYPSIEEAAKNYPIDLNSEVILWNGDDVEIGIQGKYYVSKERDKIYLGRNTGSVDSIKITYRIYDDIPDESFKISFIDNKNGEQAEVSGGIENDFYRAFLIHDSDENTAVLKVTARKNYTGGHDTDTVIIKFRNLTFELNITQYDLEDDDWGSGGNENIGLG